MKPHLSPFARPARLGAMLTGLCLLAGCGDHSGDYPALLPTDQILAEPSIPGHAAIAAGDPDQVVSDLQSAGAALAVSSAEVRAAPAANADALSSRARALRERAAALTRTDLDCEDPSDPASCEE